jgi:hypothetical protein
MGRPHYRWMRRGVAVARAIFPCADVCRGSCPGGSAAIVAVELSVRRPVRQTSCRRPEDRGVTASPPENRWSVSPRASGAELEGGGLERKPVWTWAATPRLSAMASANARLPRATTAASPSTTDLQGGQPGQNGRCPDLSGTVGPTSVG